MTGTETWIKSDHSYLPSVSLSAGCLAGAIHSSFAIKHCPKQTPLSILTSPLLISNRNPYAQVPHFSRVKEGTGLINHKDWWHGVFVVIERSHKYLILPSPSDDSPSASECLISLSAKWAVAVCEHWFALCAAPSTPTWNAAESIFVRFEKRSCGLQRNLNSEEGTLN